MLVPCGYCMAQGMHLLIAADSAYLTAAYAVLVHRNTYAEGLS